jgi:hypothetical protein
MALATLFSSEAINRGKCEDLRDGGASNRKDRETEKAGAGRPFQIRD